jgi:hypothetical protein
MATTTQQRQGKDAPTQQLLIALDLGLKTWKLGFARDFSDVPWMQEIAGSDGQALLKAIAQAKRHFKLPAATPGRSCYEAGRDGFWLHRFLEQHGVQNLVVDSASIAVERRTRRAKVSVSSLTLLLESTHCPSAFSTLYSISRCDMPPAYISTIKRLSTALVVATLPHHTER